MESGTNADNFQERLERILAPFQENNMGDCPKEFLKFNDTEDEILEEYNTGSRPKVVMPDGRLLDPYDNSFRPKTPDGEPDPMKQPEVPKGLKIREVPFKELYKTFDIFAREWHGHTERDKTTKRYGYWDNPEAKWDWYEVGGRWSGFFTLKKGKTGLKGKQYNLGGTFNESGKADICYKADVDWNKIRREAENKAGVEYDQVQEAIKETKPVQAWSEILAEFGQDRIEDARKKYWDQPRTQAFRRYSFSQRGQVSFLESVENYQVPKEQFVKQAGDGASVPFAMIKDGKWYERGEMGWFGTSRNEKDAETWGSIYHNLIKDVPEDSLLVAVDMHI
jgi:hypothetical protein